MTILFGQKQTESHTAIDVTFNNFTKEVVEASFKQLVVIDFWADWCGPCRQLFPLLQEVCGKYASKIKLVKVNVDQQPQIAQQMRIQSLPTVYIFSQGQPVDGFAGLLTKTELDQLFHKLLGPLPVEQLVSQAKEMVRESRFMEARQLLQQALSVDSQDQSVITDFFRVLILLGEIDEFIKSYKKLSSQNLIDSQLNWARSLVEWNEQSKSDQLTSQIMQKIKQGQWEQLLEELMNNIKTSGSDADKEKNLLFTLFEILGQDHPLVLKVRRQLAQLIFS